MLGKENREIKNSVFVDLFYEDESAEANEIALFNAIYGETLPAGTVIRKFRVDNIIYMNFQNDISFDVGGKVIVFGEHQSTINENMPLRSLLYIGRAYEQIVPIRDRYKRKLAPLPTPKFYTFYNGKEKWGKESYKKAIQECIEKGILADYLKRKGSEVVNMLVAEYDYEMDIEVQKEEAFESGKEQGIDMFGKLVQHLLEEGRTDELKRATEDKEFQRKLMEEYGLGDAKKTE